MANKKTKPVAKKARVGKTNTTARKTTTARKATPRTAGSKTTKRTAKSSNAIRRPDSNQPPTPEHINAITNTVLSLIGQLDNYTANLRALDRQRHNGVGLKRLGFIEAAFRLSSKFPQYFPHWLSTAKFQNDLNLFNAIRSLVEVCRSLEEKAWNINVESADMIYTNALEYYSQVQDAAHRRVDSAESLFAELYGFFRRGPIEGDQPTKKKTKRDINALMRGTKDGEVIIKNISPKTTGGTHEVIDETFKNNASFKETDEGRINE